MNLESRDEILIYKSPKNITIDDILFYKNVNTVLRCSINDLFVKGATIYDIIYSGNGKNTNDLKNLAKNGIKNISTRGFFSAMTDFLGNIGTSALSDKTTLILTDKNLIWFNLDKNEYRIFTLDEVKSFIYKKDEFFPDAIDIFESDLSDEPLMDNVSINSYNVFYDKLNKILNHNINTLTPTTDKRAKLLEIKELFEDGLINESEYKEQKQKILNN